MYRLPSMRIELRVEGLNASEGQEQVYELAVVVVSGRPKGEKPGWVRTG